MQKAVIGNSANYYLWKNQGSHTAIIDGGARGKGIGTAALSLFLDKLREQGFHCFYLETWSGNGSMLRVAEKLGFHEVFRKPACRSVGGRMFDAVTFLLRDL